LNKTKKFIFEIIDKRKKQDYKTKPNLCKKLQNKSTSNMKKVKE